MKCHFILCFSFSQTVIIIKRNMQVIDFKDTTKVLDRIKLPLNFLGIWPEKSHESLFILFSVYLGLHCSLAVVDISDNLTDIEYVVACALENVFNLMALVKMCICRSKKKHLAKMLLEIKADFFPDRYETDQEKISFLSYNAFSLKYVTIILTSSGISTLMYYCVVLAANMEMVLRNSSYGYKLPYKVKLLIEPTNTLTYVCLCSYQFLIVPSLVFGYVGTDCLLVSLALHVSGLFSALTCKVKNVLEDTNDRQRRMKILIAKHIRLIWLAEHLENDFNFMILQQMIGISFQLCLLGYDAIRSTNEGDKAKMITLAVICSCICSTLLAYCYIGECLIYESQTFGEAFYHCEWYNISTYEKKLMLIIMMRAAKQVQLTSGKFFVLSLNAFTDVVKTSMAYLSFLREAM